LPNVIAGASSPPGIPRAHFACAVRRGIKPQAQPGIRQLSKKPGRGRSRRYAPGEAGAFASTSVPRVVEAIIGAGQGSGVACAPFLIRIECCHYFNIRRQTQSVPRR